MLEGGVVGGRRCVVEGHATSLDCLGVLVDALVDEVKALGGREGGGVVECGGRELGRGGACAFAACGGAGGWCRAGDWVLCFARLEVLE